MYKAHTEEQFKEFMSQLVETNATLGFFSDFNKIAANVDAISIKLHQLNYLIGQEDMAAAIKSLWEENPKVFSVLDILIAIRTSEKKKAIDKNGCICLIEDFFETPEGVIEYIEETGLKEVLQNKKISNLVDYVFGVETGLDTNARKNRSGHIMERRIADLFSAEGIKFRQEVYSTEFEEMKCLGEDLKRFDFVITTSVKTYLIEVNFYSGGGSKLNEVARSYSELAPKINRFPNYEFIWITDGVGWKSARNKLEEAYYAIPGIYNLTTITDFIGKVKVQK
ncbi:type II restriction endonuclease [Coprobacter secundus]|uniref:Type-2 restriction enzyme n=1 Tax=Coprobacter secundus subsp. similis TaxID=2751153 RepID=A0A7G1HTP0_9BACT|nr:type II restriction endonuclease [Coprobacter secundus]BCI61784.1 type II restriction endonuclease MboI [Coprobacter secundus subsp. similis]CCY39262.1 type II site-specific deoxyribonuclease [Tannerella sp. CAG:118]